MIEHVKLIRYKFDAPDAHFDYLSLFSGTQAEKVGNTKKNSENCIRAKKKNQLLLHEIEPNLSKDRAMHEGDIILCFEMNL
jgi:hypothetical protein